MANSLWRRLTISSAAPTEPSAQIESSALESNPPFLNGIKLPILLDDTGRCKNNTSGDGHNNCGFNSILEQVGDRTHTHEMINLLRCILGYGDENSNQMFDSIPCLSVANLFGQPVAEACHEKGKLVQLSFSIPNMDLSIHFRSELSLSQNFVQWCKDYEWGQERIDSLARWCKTNLLVPLNFDTATIYDFLLKLLNYPKTIVLISASSGGHFDAVPHQNLPQEDSVLQFLRETQNEKTAVGAKMAEQKREADKLSANGNIGVSDEVIFALPNV
jgi:hypothetical protein